MRNEIDPKRIVQKYLGIKFKDGGRSIHDGFDCFGLMQAIAREQGILVPDYHYETSVAAAVWAKNFYKHVKEIDMAAVKPGDLVIFMPVTKPGIHIGTMLNSQEFIHCTDINGVVVYKLTHILYSSRIKGFYRFKETAYVNI